ncbi:site-specific tyrosine recombinase XerC [compost metagenome]
MEFISTKFPVKPIRYIKFHGLRHSIGTLLLEGETNVDSILKVIQERLGHSRKSTTEDIYVHVTKKAKKLAAVKFDKFNRKKTDDEQSTTKLKRVK